MDLNKGILNVTCVEAKLTRDTEVMGNMSPYVTFTHNKKKLKTKVHNYGGKFPKWNQNFQFEVENHSEEIFVRVWDQDLMTSDAVGFIKVKVSSLMINNGVDEWFTLYYQNASAGEIHLISTFAAEGAEEYENM